MAQLAPPKVLFINLLSLEPLEPYGQDPYPLQPWRFQGELTVQPQIHSDTRTPRPGIYNGLDIVVGDYITTQSAKVLKIASISFQDEDQITCILEDKDRLNSSVDQAQTGESSIQTGFGILFTAPHGIPLLYPLPGDTGNITDQDLLELMGRFFYSDGVGEGPPGPQGDQGPQGPSGVTNISQAEDVDITNLKDGSVLVYSTNSSKWEATNTLDKQVIDSGQY